MRALGTFSLAALCAMGCAGRRRAPPPSSDGPTDASAERPRGPLADIAPTRPPESSQPRWRYLARGQRPRGVERWRYDLTPRDASGEPATDGRTVFVAAAHATPEGPTDGEVFAFDLHDGSLRWHTPVGGVHGEPLEIAEGLVLVDTIAHCGTRADDGAGIGVHACRDARPGGVVALDATTGRERFRTTTASGALRARWSLLDTSQSRWMHDGASGLRAVTLPSGAAGPRIPTPGTVLQGVGAGADLVTLVDARRTTLLSRRATGVARPRWERAVPWRGSCAPITLGPLVILPAFSSGNLAGAPRAFGLADGVDRWTGMTPPTEVQTCAAAEGATLWQVRDGSLQGNAAADGRGRAGHALPAAPTSDLAVLLDGVFYVSQPRALLGVDVNTGSAGVSLRTEAQAVEGMVLWAGRGAVVTRQPGLVIGFD